MVLSRCVWVCSDVAKVAKRPRPSNDVNGFKLLARRPGRAGGLAAGDEPRSVEHSLTKVESNGAAKDAAQIRNIEFRQQLHGWVGGDTAAAPWVRCQGKSNFGTPSLRWTPFSHLSTTKHAFDYLHAGVRPKPVLCASDKGTYSPGKSARSCPTRRRQPA